MNRKQSLSRDIALLSVSGLLASVPAMANNWAIEEVVVTAQKRAESAQDVPVAISAFSEEMVANTGADQITDIIAMIPGLTGTSASASDSTWAIRGISTNDFTIAAEPSIGMFIDDAYIGRNPHATAAFYDIERIEVVKGPQGTLFGRNAVAGAISLSTNKPEDDINASVGGYVGNEGQQGMDLMGNMAVTDELAVRLAYHGTRLEGVFEDVAQDKEAAADSDAARLSARWNPTTDLEVLATVNYSDGETQLFGGAYNTFWQTLNDNPGADSGMYPDKIRQSGEDCEEVRTKGANVRLTWDLSDELTLTSITDWRVYDLAFHQDVDGSEADAALGGAFGFPPFNLQYFQQTNQESLSQEFRLNGTTENLDWFVGASYFKERLDEVIVVSAVNTTGIPGVIPDALGILATDSSFADGESESVGVYGDIKYAINEDLSVTAGIRWSKDDKTWCTAGEDQSGAFGFVTTAGDVCADESWTEVTPRLVLDYALGEDTMVYASFSKGYKGGGFNTTTVGGTALLGFDPETVKAYELGLKGSYLEGQLMVNAAVFFNDYQDLQIQDASTAGIFTRNAAEAETQGLELDFTYALSDALVLMGNYTYLDADFQGGQTVNPYGTTYQLQGNNLGFAPEQTYSLAVAYDLDLFGGTLSLFTAYNWTDEYHYTAENVPETTQEDYGLWNAKATFRPADEGWDAYISVDNINDEEYTTLLQDIGLGPVNVYRGMPRLMKVGFNVNF